MKLYVNSKNEFVTLTGKEATNIYGNKLLWVRCANGSTASIWENDFVKQFKAA